VAFSGRSTIGRRRRVAGSSSPAATRARQSAQAGRAGSQPNGHPATTPISGSSSLSPRTAVDFPVPLGPRTSTPPTDGLIALSRSAWVSHVCPTIAANG
jgi:hypothetical protein